jgi:hypothetical protein
MHSVIRLIIKQEKPCGMTSEGVFQGRHQEAKGGEMSGAAVDKAVPVEQEDAGSEMAHSKSTAAEEELWHVRGVCRGTAGCLPDVRVPGVPRVCRGTAGCLPDVRVPDVDGRLMPHGLPGLGRAVAPDDGCLFSRCSCQADACEQLRGLPWLQGCGWLV